MVFLLVYCVSATLLSVALAVSNTKLSDRLIEAEEHIAVLQKRIKDLRKQTKKQIKK